MFVMVGVAQLVESRIVIPVVVGSNPIIHPIFLPDLKSVQISFYLQIILRVSDSYVYFNAFEGRFLVFYLYLAAKISFFWYDCAFARVAELVDALVLGTSVFDVRVRVSPFAPVFGTGHHSDLYLHCIFLPR